MAFENLEPFRDEILALRRPGPAQKTLSEICDHLFDKHGLRTTPGTISRYLKELRQPLGFALRDPTDPERERLEAITLLTEVLVEIRGRSEEQRVAIEHLAGQMSVNTRSIEELEKVVRQHDRVGEAAPPQLLRRIWVRAFLISTLLIGSLTAAAMWFWLRPQ